MSGSTRRPMAQWRDDPSVEWVYRALRHPETGTLLFPTSRIIVKVRNATTEDALGASLPGNVTVVERLHGTTDQYILRLVEPKVDDPLAVSVALAKDANFEWAEPDFIQQWRKLDTPNDTLFNSQWHHLNTGQGIPAGVAGADSRITQGWDFATGNGNAVIAIIDDGVQLAHPDLAGRIFVNPGEIPGNRVDDDGNGRVDDVNGWDFFNNDNDPNPILTAASHGTAVAGVAAAQGNNALGGSGPAATAGSCPCGSPAPPSPSDATLGRRHQLRGAVRGRPQQLLGRRLGLGGDRRGDRERDHDRPRRQGRARPLRLGQLGDRVHHVRAQRLPPGTYTFELDVREGRHRHAGLDSAWLDNVIYPDGSVDTFEGCAGLPAGWTHQREPPPGRR